jgi:hypothetical protein
MSTAISTTAKVVDYPALSPNSRQAQVIAANLDGEPMLEQDLPRIKTPLGGATKWTVEVQGNSETTDEVIGLLVGVAKRGVLWPHDDPSEDRPVIVSNDLQIGYRVSDDLGSIEPAALDRYRIGDRRYDWVALANSPEFGYGSARGGAGKRCKESRILAILRNGDVWPVLVQVGPGSLREWGKFHKNLPAFHYECVVGLRLEKAKGKNGQPYSTIVPRIVGLISEEQGEVARRVYAEPLKKMFTQPPFGAVVEAIRDEE